MSSKIPAAHICDLPLWGTGYACKRQSLGQSCTMNRASGRQPGLSWRCTRPSPLPFSSRKTLWRLMALRKQVNADLCLPACTHRCEHMNTGGLPSSVKGLSYCQQRPTARRRRGSFLGRSGAVCAVPARCTQHLGRVSQVGSHAGRPVLAAA